MECSVPDKPGRIDVGVGEIAVARAPDILHTAALGSCVGVALWDPFAQNGGLAHVMLPRATDTVASGPQTRFAESAITGMVDMLREMGSPKRRLLAKIAGGAAMFRAESNIAHVGDRNVEAVREQLESLGIPIRAEDVGAHHARTVDFHLDSGTLIVRSYVFGIKEL
jgi:chemotaxis protein CheD